MVKPSGWRWGGLAFEPAVLLLDEPLSALDEQTRDEMFSLLLSIKRATHVTTLHVTHHSAEAAALGDRCLRIENGSLETGTISEDRDLKRIRH